MRILLQKIWIYSKNEVLFHPSPTNPPSNLHFNKKIFLTKGLVVFDKSTCEKLHKSAKYCQNKIVSIELVDLAGIFMLVMMLLIISALILYMIYLCLLDHFGSLAYETYRRVMRFSRVKTLKYEDLKSHIESSETKDSRNEFFLLDTCSICFSRYRNSEEILLLKCKHCNYLNGEKFKINALISYH